MKKYLSLVRLLFTQQYRVKPSVSGKKKKGGTIALIVVLALCFLPMLIGMATGLYFLGTVSRNLDNLAKITSVLLLACQGLVLVFGLPSLISTVFSAKDADKLLFLPVRSSTLFAAKLTVVYLNEVITTVVTLLVTLLPFGLGLNASAAYYLLLPVALILVPLLPMLVGAIVAMPMSAIIAKFSKNGIVKAIMQMVLFVLLMAIYMFVMYQMGLMGGNAVDPDMSDADLAKILLDKLNGVGGFAKYVHSNFTLASALVGATAGAVALNLLITFAENVLLFGLVLLLSLPFYHWLLLQSVGDGGGTSRKKGAKAELQVANKGVLRELIFTDIKRVIRDGQMGFQCLMSLIAVPLVVVIFYIGFGAGAEDGESIAGFADSPFYQAIAPLVFVGLMSMLGMTSNVLGIYPISRENKSLYLIKSLPVSFSKYLLAKVILSSAALLIVDVITCVLVGVLFRLEWYYCILMLVVIGLLIFGAMCITTLLDLKSPKLGWTNFNQGLKNAKNSWIGMLIGVICMFVVAIVAVACIITWNALNKPWYMLMIMWLLIIGLSAGFAVVSYRIMTKNAQRYFDNIEP